jgi:hypothetical protein
MKQNVGNVDRWIRIVLGVAILSLLVFLNGPIRWIGLVGLIPLVTGILNFCPIYALLGISTKKDQTK